MQNDHDPEMNDAPHLSKLSRENFLKAPEGYFAKLPDQLHHRMKAGEERTSVLKLKPVAAGLSVLAAAVVAVAVIFHTNDDAQPKMISSYDDLVSSGYIYDYDESLLINEYTIVSAESSRPDEAEEYLYNNTDESFLSEAQ